MRVIFMGTPDFSVPVLDALVEAGHEIAAVYCQPPRPAGRGKKDRPTPVHARADALGLEVRHPVSLKSSEEQASFAELEADIAVVVAYGLILPQAILDAPAKGCLNIHASLLPRWRGAAPIHRAILSGDAQTGICIMQMEAGLDTGPVLLRAATDIGPQETTAQLHDRLSNRQWQSYNFIFCLYDSPQTVSEQCRLSRPLFERTSIYPLVQLDWIWHDGHGPSTKIVSLIVLFHLDHVIAIGIDSGGTVLHLCHLL